MLKLVLDTNTLVSAFFWDGNEAELFRKIEKGKALNYISIEIIDEVKKVLCRPKFNNLIIKSGISIEEIINKIMLNSHIAIGKKFGIDVCRDKEDNKFLECAKLAGAYFIVSGDKDLLDLNKFENIKIVRTIEILRLIR